MPRLKTLNSQLQREVSTLCTPTDLSANKSCSLQFIFRSTKCNIPGIQLQNKFAKYIWKILLLFPEVHGNFPEFISIK